MPSGRAGAKVMRSMACSQSKACSTNRKISCHRHRSAIVVRAKRHMKDCTVREQLMIVFLLPFDRWVD